MIVGAIGPVLFSVTRQQVFTFTGLAQKRRARFAEHQVIEGLSRLQHLGRELDTLSLNVILASAEPTIVLLDAAVFALLHLAETGDEYPLVFGVRYWGKWVVTDADVSFREFHMGQTWRAGVALSLKEYN